MPLWDNGPCTRASRSVNFKTRRHVSIPAGLSPPYVSVCRFRQFKDNIERRPTVDQRSYSFISTYRFLSESGLPLPSVLSGTQSAIVQNIFKCFPRVAEELSLLYGLAHHLSARIAYNVKAVVSSAPQFGYQRDPLFS